MNPLILMYVYFDTSGDIKAISPDVILSYEGVYQSATFSLAQVSTFLEGKANTFNYFIKKDVKGFSTEYIIAPKSSVQVSNLRTLDSYLEDISKNTDLENSMMCVHNDTLTKDITIIINPELYRLQESGNDSEKKFVESFLNIGRISLFFTRKNDPYYLNFTLDFTVTELHKAGTLCVEHNLDLSDTSIFTRKITNGYRYIER
jgi:hypothetical protein